MSRNAAFVLRAVFLKKKKFSKEKAFPLAKRAKALSRNKEIPISFTKKVFLESILSAKDVNLILLHKLKHQMDGFMQKSLSENEHTVLSRLRINFCNARNS